MKKIVVKEKGYNMAFLIIYLGSMYIIMLLFELMLGVEYFIQIIEITVILAIILITGIIVMYFLSIFSIKLTKFIFVKKE